MSHADQETLIQNGGYCTIKYCTLCVEKFQSSGVQIGACKELFHIRNCCQHVFSRSRGRYLD